MSILWIMQDIIINSNGLFTCGVSVLCGDNMRASDDFLDVLMSGLLRLTSLCSVKPSCVCKCECL